MRKILFTICLIMGCASNEELVSTDKDALGSYLNYYKDTKTNVCYSAMFLRANTGVLTSVPCTPEVEEVAHKFRSSSK